MAGFNKLSMAMNAGGKGRRKRWPEGNYCFLERHGRKDYAMMYSAKHDEIIPIVFYWDDATAKDWEILPSTAANIAA